MAMKSPLPSNNISEPALRKWQGVWWDRLDHPMTDAQFVQAFCEHVLITTADRSLTTVRNRAYRFIRTFMIRELEEQLTKYREDFS